MIMMKPGRLFASAAFAGVLAFAAAPANALTTCAAFDLAEGTTVVGAVSNTDECEIGGGANTSVGTINGDNVFGFGDWIFDGKIESDVGAVGSDSDTLDLVLAAGDPSTWTINDLWATYTDIMLIFKDGVGSGNIIPDTYVAYLIIDGLTSGTFTSMFQKVDKDGDLIPFDFTQISHVSIFYRECDPCEVPLIPLPAALPIFLITLGGAALFARRRRPA